MRENLQRQFAHSILLAAASKPQRQDVATESCQERQDLAEPLWFAIMCRKLWGANAPKELHFMLGRSERTCRAWASGDSMPPSDILAALIVSEHGRAVQDFLMHMGSPPWWQSLLRAERIVAAEDQIDRS